VLRASARTARVPASASRISARLLLE
jgi:hypothetical protein